MCWVRCLYIADQIIEQFVSHIVFIFYILLTALIDSMCSCEAESETSNKDVDPDSPGHRHDVTMTSTLSVSVYTLYCESETSSKDDDTDSSMSTELQSSISVTEDSNTSIVSLDNCISRFKTKIIDGPFFVCSVCQRSLF